MPMVERGLEWLKGLGEARSVRKQQCLERKVEVKLEQGSGSDKYLNSEPAELPEEFCRWIGDQLIGEHRKQLEADGVLGRIPQSFCHAEDLNGVDTKCGVMTRIIFVISYLYVNEYVPCKLVARYDIPGRGKVF
jgi:hypothetical protein